MTQTDPNPADQTPLIKRIRQRMKSAKHQAIPFRDYMELCLYEPEYGYYTKDRTKIGKDGDFYTSAHIGSVLGDIIAAYIHKRATGEAETFTVCEWGAGSGRLAGQILDALEQNEPLLYAKLTYRIVERSPYHRQLQQEVLSRHEAKLHYPTAGCEHQSNDLVFCNELLDAFPVHRVRRQPEGLMELHVAWDETANRLHEVALPCENAALLEYLQEGNISLLEGQTADISLEAAGWVAEQVRELPAGSALLMIDYGAQTEEIFAAHRMSGTLMCYKDHLAHENPYIHPGEQDITAHVDFGACIRAGKGAGVSEVRLFTQKQFLLEYGVLDLLQGHSGFDPFSPEARRNRSIRQLLLSDQMSELFKVLILSK